MQDADTVRFADRFRARPDVHARMWHQPRKGTGYSPVHAPLDAEVARAHLEGRLTAGIYLVRADSTVRHAVIDLDATREALAAAERDRRAAGALWRAVHDDSLRLRGALEAAGFAPLLVDSGYKGRHLWCFLADPAPASQVRAALSQAAAQVVLDARLRVEVFPKQDRVRRGGLGNLVKLPLGVHLRTGRLARVLGPDGRPVDDGLAELLAWPTSPAPEVAWSERSDSGEADAAPVDPARAMAVMRGCPMVRTAMEEARRDRTVSHDAIVVLNHSLGHLPSGVELLQQLYAEIPGLPEAAIPRAARRGYPIGCDRVRQRLAPLLQRVPCDCVFADRAGEYPHPLRHLDRERDLDQLTGELADARRRSRELEHEVAERLATDEGGRHSVEGGAWVRAPDGSVQFVPDEGR